MVKIFRKVKAYIANYRERRSMGWSTKRRIAVGAVLAAMLLYILISYAVSSGGSPQGEQITHKFYGLQISGFDVLVLIGGLGVFAARKIYSIIKEKQRK